MTGKEAREKRIKLGKSLIDTAMAVGISNISLGYFEKGARQLRPEHLEKLKIVLGVEND